MTGYMVSASRYFELVRESGAPVEVQTGLAEASKGCIRSDDGLLDSFKAGFVLGIFWKTHPEYADYLQKILELVRNRDLLPFLEIGGRPVDDQKITFQDQVDAMRHDRDSGG